MLQYFAVGLCTGSPHPTRAQIRCDMEVRPECLNMPASDATVGVYAAALTVCQLSRCVCLRARRDAFDTRRAVDIVDN